MDEKNNGDVRHPRTNQRTVPAMDGTTVPSRASTDAAHVSPFGATTGSATGPSHATNGSEDGSSNGSSNASSGSTGESAAVLSLASEAVWDALRSPLRLQVLEAVRSRPGIDARGLAEALATRPPKLYYHLKILVSAGLLRESDVPGGGGGNGSRNSRGPASTGYHATHDDHPDGFFDGHPTAALRSMKLVHGIAQTGIKAALSPRAPRIAGRASTKGGGSITGGRIATSDGPAGGRGLAEFRNEALDATEIETIRRHIEAIRGILTAARARRRSARELIRATAFVGVCIAELERAVLPDGPVGSNGR